MSRSLARTTARARSVMLTHRHTQTRTRRHARADTHAQTRGHKRAGTNAHAHAYVHPRAAARTSSGARAAVSRCDHAPTWHFTNGRDMAPALEAASEALVQRRS